MFRIAILYICTGKYSIFWKDFYNSCERHFLKTVSIKEYFVFTDNPKIYKEEDIHVHKIFQESLEWPLPTLMRFHFFDTIREKLNKFDYIYFFNANMLFVDDVGEEIIPFSQKLLVVKHPGHIYQNRQDLPYERNSNSIAFVADNQGNYYYMGGLNGGDAGSYLKLISKLKSNIDKDLNQNIIAIWHDESYLNKYMVERDPKILSPSYGYPEGWDLPFKPKIIIRDKNNYGGHNFLRNKKASPFLLIQYIKKTLRLITKSYCLFKSIFEKTNGS